MYVLFDRLKMETRFASRSAAVSEVLDVDNYLVWSVQLRNYLMVHDLWDIVKATNEPPKLENDEAASKAWSRKNIMALHMIQISCGQRICFVISLITSAKIAWDTLEEICRIPKNVYEGISLSLKHFVIKHQCSYEQDGTTNILQVKAEVSIPYFLK